MSVSLLLVCFTDTCTHVHANLHVPIFHSDEVADETVSCTALYKVLLSCEEALRVSVSKLSSEVIEQRARVLLLDLM